MSEKIFGEPKNAAEKDILEYIEPLITDEAAKTIKEKKLTLGGCWDFCLKKGKKYEVKNGNQGVALVSAEQHHKWVCEYFGVKPPKEKSTAPASAPVPKEAASTAALALDFDDLL